MALLTIKNLTLGYDTQVVAEGLNFEVNEGDYLCIVGENGSGKTTLMKTLLGLAKPLKGDVLMGDGLKRTEIGYLPQQTAYQRDFPASVKEIVLSGCQGSRGLRPFYGRADKKLAAESMEKMGITDLADKCYRNLSGGQQQRVLLARAICAGKRIILMDEPVTGLDMNASAHLYEIINMLNKEGVTIVMISHDVAEAVGYASHILYMSGEVFFGTRDEYLKEGYAGVFLKDTGDKL